MAILSGVRVVEISRHGAAAMAAKHFADWGAEIVLLEPRGGTPLRQAPPFYVHDGERRSSTWQWLSRGKSACTLAPEEARALCELADVVLVESELTEAVLGLEPQQVREWIEGKTTCVLIAPFGIDGPLAAYRATDLGLLARGGWMNNLRSPGREPLRPGNDMLSRVTGVCAAMTALIGLRHLRLGGRPQFVELVMQALAAAVLTGPWLVRSITGRDPGGPRPEGFPPGALECKDGFFGCTPLTATHWEMMCRMLGIEDVLELPGGREPEYRAEHGAELLARVQPFLNTQSKHELMKQAQEWRIPAAPIEDVAERLEDPQLNARGFFKQIEIDGRTVKVPRAASLIEGVEPVERGPLVEAAGPPIPLPIPAREGRSVGAPADGDAETDHPFLPRLGDPGVPGAEPRGERRRPSMTRGIEGPFAGIKVLDLTHFWAGPYATMILGSLGADVIKIESIQRPDAYRFTGVPPAPKWYERGPLWNDSNSDKRDLTLDLASPAGKEIFARLAQDADLVISNFSNRVMPNLGLTNEYLHTLNPRLIVCTLPGYGPDGPWGNYVGYGVAFEQLAVCASITGYEDGPPRIMGGFSDPTSGMHTVIAFELALRERERTGKGTVIEIPQCEIVDSLFGPEDIAVQHGAPVPRRRSNKHDWMAPHNAYQTGGDDEWITIAVAEDAEFQALCRVVDREKLAGDLRFATVAARKENEAALDVAIAAAVRSWPLLKLEAVLQAAGVMGCRVTPGPRLDDDVALQRFGFFQEQSRLVSGTHPYKTWPFRFSDIATVHRRPPPLLGEHNHEILRGLGLSAEEIQRLEEQKVIGTVPLGFG